MAVDVTIFERSRVEGGGFNSNGVASNSKVKVVGRANVTTYTAGGEPVSASDLGLDTLDAIFLSAKQVDGADPAATNIVHATYDYTAGKMLAWDGAAAVTVPGTSVDFLFVAYGDSAAAPDLT